MDGNRKKYNREEEIMDGKTKRWAVQNPFTGIKNGDCYQRKPPHKTSVDIYLI